jgi:hypothetical protein
MNSTLIKQALSEITQESMTNGSMSSLWEMLPDYVAGSQWVGEIVDLSEQLSDYFTDGEDVQDYKLSDYCAEIADCETQDYYSNINKRVQELSLWAYPALDDSVAELGTYNAGTITSLNSLYLYCAMRESLDSIAGYVARRVEEQEEELANA